MGLGPLFYGAGTPQDPFYGTEPHSYGAGRPLYRTETLFYGAGTPQDPPSVAPGPTSIEPSPPTHGSGAPPPSHGAQSSPQVLRSLFAPTETIGGR